MWGAFISGEEALNLTIQISGVTTETQKYLVSFSGTQQTNWRAKAKAQVPQFQVYSLIPYTTSFP